MDAAMNKLDPGKTALLIINMTNDLLGWEGVRPLVPPAAKTVGPGSKVRCHRRLFIACLL